MALMSLSSGWKSVPKCLNRSSVVYSRKEADSGEGQGCCVAADDACILKRVLEARNTWCRFETKDAHTRVSARLRAIGACACARRHRITASGAGAATPSAYASSQVRGDRRGNACVATWQQQRAECTDKHTECSAHRPNGIAWLGRWALFSSLLPSQIVPCDTDAALAPLTVITAEYYQ